MEKEQFSQVLEELMKMIGDGPGSHTDILSQTAQRNAAEKELQESISKLGESLATVRIVVKYLVFDLEATRRERDKLRMLLEDQD